MSDEDKCRKCGDVRRLHTSHGDCSGVFSRYDTRDVCTPCWYDNCENCDGHRGQGCACQRFNHPRKQSMR